MSNQTALITPFDFTDLNLDWDKPITVSNSNNTYSSNIIPSRSHVDYSTGNAQPPQVGEKVAICFLIFLSNEAENTQSMTPEEKKKAQEKTSEDELSFRQKQNKWLINSILGAIDPDPTLMKEYVIRKFGEEKTSFEEVLNNIQTRNKSNPNPICRLLICLNGHGSEDGSYIYGPDIIPHTTSGGRFGDVVFECFHEKDIYAGDKDLHVDIFCGQCFSHTDFRKQIVNKDPKGNFVSIGCFVDKYLGVTWNWPLKLKNFFQFSSTMEGEVHISLMMLSINYVKQADTSLTDLFNELTDAFHAKDKQHYRKYRKSAITKAVKARGKNYSEKELDQITSDIEQNDPFDSFFDVCKKIDDKWKSIIILAVVGIILLLLIICLKNAKTKDNKVLSLSLETKEKEAMEENKI